MKNWIENLHATRLMVLLGILLAFTLSSCNKDDDDNDVIEPAEVAYVSLFNASPDAPALNVYLDNRRVNYNPLPYATFTSYLNFYAGERQMRVRPYNADNVILDTTFTFMDNQAYSLFYVNRVANIEAMVVKDSLINPGTGKAAVRFIHLSPDAPAVTVSSTDQSEVPLFSSQAYMQASPFKILDSGVQSFQVKADGTNTVVLSIPDVNLLSGGVYTIVARGFLTPPAGNSNALGAQIIRNN